VNLLQPQDRKSLNAGDSREAVEARASLLDAGVGRAVLESVAGRAAALLDENQSAVVAELGSGSGELLGKIAADRSIRCVGFDLSTHAATHAARRFPSISWVVANADRRLPLLNASTGVILSVHARRNPPECRRVLVDGGFLLLAIPSSDDLIELREEVQGHAVERDRVSAVVDEHAAHFVMVDRSTSTQRLELDRDQLHKLLRGTYRGERFSENARVQALDHLSVTLSSDILLFRKT
jgi:23S rRNA (guanine745-N1)-methyltransferase